MSAESIGAVDVFAGGLAGVEFGDHQRFALKLAVLVCLVMLIASLACAIFPLAA